MKRIVSLLLALIMVIGMTSFTIAEGTVTAAWENDTLHETVSGGVPAAGVSLPM